MQIITHINNAKCLEWGLNANQGALFDMLNQSASWAKTVVIDGEVWYWVSRNKVIEELPLYYTKPDTVYRHLKALDKSGLIKHQKHGDKDLIMLTEKGKTWNNKVVDNLPKNDDKKHSEINPTLGNKSENTRIEIRNSSDSNPTYQHTNSSVVNNQDTPLPPRGENPPDEKSVKPKSEIPKTHEQAKAVVEKITKAKFSADDLVALGVGEQTAKDWLIARKAPLTKTALIGVINQAQIAKLSVADAVQHAAENGWRGFRADWLHAPNTSPPEQRREKNISTYYDDNWTSPHLGVSS